MRSRLQFVAVLVLVALSNVGVAAQDTIPVRQQQQRPPSRLTPSDILERLRASGLTREQLRERLRMAGYDPALADRYFDEVRRDSSRVETGAAGVPVARPTSTMVEALRRIGVLLPTDSLAPADSLMADSARTMRRDRRSTTAPQIFGRELFSASTTQFQPISAGPVDPDYRLGPGDEVTLIITGDVQAAYPLRVTPEGFIVIPEVGQVLAAGLTMEGLKRRLNERLGRVYSGVQTGSTQFDLSTGRLRRNLIYIIGEVDIPGAQLLGGGSTVFNALYQAGGPSEQGSFRQIELRRDNAVIRTVDLYDYLMRGDKSGDIRLDQGDVIFVPIAGPRVTVTGSVNRPAIFELKPGETLSDVLRFAGGIQAEAAVDRVQIDRILPPSQRQAGVYPRILVDVPLADLRAGSAVPLHDGDRVLVFAVSTERRNRITITGDVQRPGEYEYRAQMTAADAIQRAQGLQPSAYTPTAHVVRLNLADSTTTLIRVTFDDPNSPIHASRVVLRDLDEIVVFSRTQMAIPENVEIFGMVKDEGLYPFSRGMTVQDLVLLAGGLQEGALEREVEVARRIATASGDSVAVVHRVPFRITGAPPAGPQDFTLQPGDQVFVRRIPGYEPLKTVQIGGEVVYPGGYTVESKQERVSNLIRRAGGLTSEAYAPGFRLFRGDRPVAINLPRAIARPGSADDLIIEPGDRLEVPRYDPTVLVTGAVAFETRVRYQSGLDLDDYIERAGGARDDADVDNASVRYPNGELRTVRSYLGISRMPNVQPGSTITVPSRPEINRFNWDQFLARSLSVLSTLATLIVAANAIR